MSDASAGRGWLEHLLIVPGAHVRVGDFDFQAAMYEQFHQRWGCRILHALCTPLVLVGAMLALGAIPLEVTGVHVPVGPVVLATGLAAYFVGLDALIGVVAIPVVAALLAASVALGHALGGHAPWVGFAMTSLAAMVQAGSHLFEDVPPPWSGTHPRPFREVLRDATPRVLAGLAMLTLVSFVLEWWASFRVLGMQINFALMQLGLRRELRERLEARIASAA
jgi:hypothetical protein